MRHFFCINSASCFSSDQICVDADQEVMKYEEELYSEDDAKTETCDSPGNHACSAKDRARERVERAVHEQFGQQVRP